MGQLRLLPCFSSDWSDLDLANAAVFISALVLISCGYFIGIKKSVLIPVQVIPSLGFLSDAKKQAFTLPEEKKQKFPVLRDSLINMKVIPVKSLQMFACKAVSFSLAVPAARRFCRQINKHIGKGLKSSRSVKMTESLNEELEH